MAQKKKPALTPEAAKILEQYRNAGKAPANGEGGVSGPDGGSGNAPKPTGPPPAAAVRPRSGTRGK